MIGKEPNATPDCPVEAALEVMGGKWKCLILRQLTGETLRFNELRRAMPGVTQRMLTKQLRELESHEVISRKIYPEVPPRVEYAITEYGLTLVSILEAMHDWGQTHLQKR